MIKKNGITITTLAITIIVIGILATAITTSIYSTINFSRLTTWVNEIGYIQDALDEKLKSSSAISLSLGTTSIDLSGLLSDQITKQFEGEIVSNESVELQILDLGLLNITDTSYGNKETENDVYAYSETTGRVYYVQGIEINNETYYTVIDTVLNMFGIEEENRSLTTVVFVPSKIGYTNEAVKVTVKVPSEFTGVTVTTSDNNIQVGTRILNESLYEYEVNTGNVTGNYIVTVTYTNDGTEYTSTYEVNGYDNELPVISVSKDVGKIEITSTDNVGVRKIKYIEGEIESADIEEYFKKNGKNVLNNNININNSVNKYTIYSEDLAGNYSYTIVTTRQVTYTNQILISTDENGNIYNNGLGYRDGYRLNSSGVDAASEGAVTTGFIPVSAGDTIRLAGEFIGGDLGTENTWFYKSDFTKADVTNITPYKFKSEDASISVFEPYTYDRTNKQLSMFTIPNDNTIAYMRCTLNASTGADAIITVNEKID